MTRIKICGLTRLEDVKLAVDAGADAIGLVFYPPSPRYVDLQTAAMLARAIPPFVSIVGLFVNADAAIVNETLAAVPLHVLQFHGDEDEGYCHQFNRPYLKAARVKPGMDLLQYTASFPSAQAILLDAFVEVTAAVARFSTGRRFRPRWPNRSCFPAGWMPVTLARLSPECDRQRLMCLLASRRPRESRMLKRYVLLLTPCVRRT